MAARINKIKHDEATKDKIRGSQIVNFLCKQALDQGDIQAAKAVLPFLKPALSSQELTTVEPVRPESEIMSELASKLLADKAFLERLLPGYTLVKLASLVQPDHVQAPDNTEEQPRAS